MLQVNRQRGEVGRLAGEHDLLGRRLRPRDLDDLRLDGEPAPDLAGQFAWGHPEGVRDPGAAAGDIAHQLLALRPDRAEHDGLGIVLERGRHVGEIGRRPAGLALAFRQALDEAAQPEPLAIHRARLRPGLGLLDDAHADPPGRTIAKRPASEIGPGSPHEAKRNAGAADPGLRRYAPSSGLREAGRCSAARRCCRKSRTAGSASSPIARS